MSSKTNVLKPTILDFMDEQKNKRRGILEAMAHWCPSRITYAIGFFCQQIIEPIKYGYFKAKRFDKFLQDSQWWAMHRLEEYQNKQLKLLIEYVYKNVPYYGELFSRNRLTPGDFYTLKDLEKLPILTKEDVVNNFDKLLAKHIPPKEFKKRSDLRYTSGSTGKSLFYYADKKNYYISFTLSNWVCKMIDINFSAPYIRLWSRPFIEKGISDIVLYEPYFMRVSLSTLPQNLERLDEYIQIIKSFKPIFIAGSPSFLYTLASYAQSRGDKDVHFRVFLSCYENIYPYQKKAIESQFQCEIFSNYGTEEFSLIALECNKHEGMHIEIRKGVMEIVDENGKVLPQGQRGRTIYTGFNNYLMPLIRYELGDIGVISDRQCSCGRGLPLLESLDGRSSEIIKFNNKNIYPATLSVILERIKSIKECQFIQTEKNKIKVNIVKRKEYSSKDSQELIEAARRLIDDEVDLEINFVDNIPRTKMGKFPFVVNLNKKENSNDG